MRARGVSYSSNIFAILGLRSLYVLVAKAVNDLPYLKVANELLKYRSLPRKGVYFARISPPLSFQQQQKRARRGEQKARTHAPPPHT